MRHFWLVALLIGGANAFAAPVKTFAFTFRETPLTKVVEYYTTQTGQKFVIDSGLAATVKVTIVQPHKVTAAEAFNLLSASLALSDVAISDRNGTFVLAPARNVERSYIPVVMELPPLQPEKLVTWIINLKNADASGIMQQLRILTSKDGELAAYGPNRLMITDWVSNLYRVKELIDQIDKPVEGKSPSPTPSDSKG